ncbi:MAG: DUF3560 domain-containing protein [Oscillospiraceae bacterium]|nr:DUF3560 domain-containing protein [Oscillospiraceae bacterium]
MKQYEEFTSTLFAEETAPETVPAIAEKAEPTAFEQKFYDRADRKEARAAKTSAQATAKAESGWAMLDAIPLGQPVHGTKDRRYRDKAGAKIDSGYAMMQKADYQERKAEASREYAEKVQSGAIARSDDPEAIQKLEKRIAELAEQHEKAKQAVKAHNAEVDRLMKSGELEAVVLDPWGQPLKDDASEWAKKHAYTAYYKDGKRVCNATVEQSTTAEIRRLKKRIEEIRKTAEICADSDGWNFEGGRIELNAEAGRIQAFFDEIPSEEIRKNLKSDCWKWSRTAKAWQKMLNPWNIRRAKASDIFKPLEDAPEQAEEQPEIIEPEQMPEEPEPLKPTAEPTTEAEKEESVQAETVATEQKQDAEPEKQEEPETSKPKKSSKKAKKEVLTPEEMAEKLEKMRNNDNWREYAISMMMFTNKNHAIIMCEGIAAGVITFEEFEEYMTSGRMPHYHTYQEWAKLGRQVKQGEHARFKARIWKYTEKHGEMTAEQAESLNAIMMNADGKQYQAGDETTESRFVKKEAFFFGIDQTEKAGTIQKFEIGKQYETRAGIITVTDRSETELTFTAKGRTFTKEIQNGKKSEFVRINKAGATVQASAEVQDVPETQPEEPEETAKAEQPEVKQETTEPETVKFIQGLVYWRKYQILNKSDKMLTIKNILTGEIFRKKIRIYDEKCKTTEYIKLSEYQNLHSSAPSDTYSDAVQAGLALYQESAPRHRKEADKSPFNGYKRQNAEEAEKLLATYQRLADELKEQAA